MQIMPNYFLIRIDKRKQQEFREKVAPGSALYQSQTNLSHTKGLEAGEIVQIGSRVLQSEEFYGAFDECKPGDTLIIHWAIEAEIKGQKNNWLFEDQTFNYYFVPERDVRGYYDGVKIVPHPKYVFLKDLPRTEEKKGTIYDKALGANMTNTKSGIVLFADWNKSKKKIEDETVAIDARMKSLSAMKQSEELDKEFLSLQKQKTDKNRQLRKKEIIPLKIAFSSKKLNVDCGIRLEEDDIAYVENYAAEYRCNFQLQAYKYILCLVDYVVRVEKNKEKATA
jgi:hypothetical protein